MPWARFYTRSLYWDVSETRKKESRGRFKLSHQSVRSLKKWRSLIKQELDGRPMIPNASATIPSDAADSGYGGTLNNEDLRAGIDGHWRAQSIWNWRDRAESISYRELKVIRLLLSGNLGLEVKHRGHRQILPHVENQAVVHIANSFVSASRPMMRELRKLNRVLDRMGFVVKAEWLPSVANKVADGLSRRLADPQAAAALRSGWYERSGRCFPVPSARRTSNDEKTPSIRRIEQPVGERRGPSSLPGGGSDYSDGDETAGIV